jgi:hypothetical protein
MLAAGCANHSRLRNDLLEPETPLALRNDKLLNDYLPQIRFSRDLSLSLKSTVGSVKVASKDLGLPVLSA